MIEQLIQMRRHSFIAKHQQIELRKLKNSLKENEAILHVDFAENFNIKHQKGIMSAHFKQSDKSRVTLFTAIIYMPNKEMFSYVVVSDCLEHDKYAVAAFNRKILNEAKSKNKSFKTLHVFSDGAGGQFKNCFTLSFLTEPCLLNNNIDEMD